MQEYLVNKSGKDQYSAKIIVLGNSLVGKTSILSRYVKNIFNENNESVTIGMDYVKKKIELENLIVKMEFWDTAGQERFRAVIQQYYYDSHAVLVVFDLTNPKSFSDLKYWVEQINNNFDNNVIRFLLGNKCDMTKEIKIKREDIEKFGKDFGFLYYETSAKMNTNLEECFIDLAKLIKERFWDTRKISFDNSRFNTVILKEPIIQQKPNCLC